MHMTGCMAVASCTPITYDLVLLSPTEKGLQDHLKILETFSSTWALPINEKKTNIMVFQKRKQKPTGNPTYMIDNRPLTETNRYTYLGLELSQSGSFKQAIESLKDKASKAFYAIRRRLYHLKAPVTVWLKNFDSIIAPILLYGSEVWGPVSYPNWSKWDAGPTEIFHLEFCKHLLQVHRSTSNSACRAELGRFTLHIAIKKKALSFNAHLQSSSPSSYHHKALLHQKASGSLPRKSTQSQSDQAINLHGLTKGEIQKMVHKVKEEYLSIWRNDINKSQKLTIYRNLQREYKLAPYLEKLENPKDRQILSRYRLSAHSLLIESGRHRQNYKPRESRLCQQCPQEAVEDEAHFLLRCPKYSAYPWKPFVSRKLPHAAIERFCNDVIKLRGGGSWTVPGCEIVLSSEDRKRRILMRISDPCDLLLNMGIQGFMTFVSSHSNFFQELKLKNTKLIIDGNNLYHKLYFDSGLDLVHGGEYDKFTDVLHKFFESLSVCSIQAYVVFDGGCDISNKKLETQKQRFREKIRMAQNLSQGKGGSVLPL
ncbi:unnamed protein product [Ranitomeya imitator]|uniref:XPG N-terminal domain-containing protein n=1 Tax=Ranitomeya imitator TaxID=111125 RepID=A0ABN9LE42_9NEOB|nr:unnamed protein product [Ranitomeya imitator]